MTKVITHAGTLESNDIYITLEKKSLNDDIQIDLQSTVISQFGYAIKDAIAKMIYNAGITQGLHIIANDKGALPCTIEARMKTVLLRANLIKEEQQ